MAAVSARSWSVREASRADWPMIRELMVTSFGEAGEVRPAAYNDWLYEATPFGKSLSFVAMDGDRCVGHEGLLPARLRLGSETVAGAQSMDTMTHPDYRGQGVFVAVAGAAIEHAASLGMEVFYGFPNPTSLPGLLRLNWDHVTDVPNWTRPVCVASLLPPVVGPLAELVAGWLPRGRRAGVEVRAGRPDAAELDAVLDRWRAQKRLCRVDRSAAWLDWRYDPRSGVDFDWFGAYRGGQAVGYGVAGARTAAWSTGRMHIFELTSDDSEASSAMLAAMIDRATERSMRVLKAATNDPELVRLLRRTGFIKRGSRGLLVRAQTARVLGGNIHMASSWRIDGGDADTA
jgi:predicted N-acetyltransferase YhbS